MTSFWRYNDVIITPCVQWALQICHVEYTRNCHYYAQLNDNISYPLFADADTGIYPHAASQYHARPKAKRGIVMLSVDKFP